jgi:ABC-2 type transport system permease protein
VPQLPAASLTLLPLVVMSAVAAGLTLIGLIGLRRRDIARI